MVIFQNRLCGTFRKKKELRKWVKDSTPYLWKERVGTSSKLTASDLSVSAFPI